jgi:LacI family kdg operon repressor
MNKFITASRTSRVTINDVAKLAGVSKTTVSRYIGRHYDSLAEKTRKKIEEAIDTLGYRPNVMAMGLKGNKSRIIGMVIADITNPFSTEMLRGAETICKKNDYSLIVCNTDNDPVEELDYIFMLQAHRIDGLIINTTGKNNEFLYKLAADDEIPVVLVDRKIPELDFDTISVDNKEGTSEIVNFLLEKGYERIAFFTEPVKKISSRIERMDTFIKILSEKKHMNASKDLYEIDINISKNLENGINSFLENSQKNSRVIFATNGVILLKIMSIIKSKNLRIPEDIGIVGFDNPEWTEIIGNGITTFAQPAYKIGNTAMNRILSRINGDVDEPKIIELPGQLIIRGSTQ